MNDIIRIEAIDSDGKEVLSDHAGKTLINGWVEEMQKDLQPISTTIKGLDDVLGGLWGMSVIGGGPATGKTALCVQIAEHYAIQGGPVIYLAFEQGPSGFFSRLYQRFTGVSTKDQREHIRKDKGTVKAFRDHIANMPNLRVLGLPKGGDPMHWNELQLAASTMQEATKKKALIVVDSLHYTPLGPENDNLDGKRAINKALQIFTGMHQDTGATIAMIAHQTKAEVKGKEKDLMSYSGSATIGYAVDIAIQLTVDEQKNREISIPKNRGGSPLTRGLDIDYDLNFQKMK